MGPLGEGRGRGEGGGKEEEEEKEEEGVEEEGSLTLGASFR